MLSSLKQSLRRQQFAPNLIGAFVNPFYLARRALYRNMRSLAPSLSGRLLDVGCGRKPYSDLFSVSEYVGLEIDSPVARAIGAADYYYDGTVFPFPDAHFDSVLCNQVLEHVFNPPEFLSEIRRVLRPGGRLILTVPFVWDEHEQPFDYARYSSFGLKHVLGVSGFQIVDARKTLTDISILGQMFNAYIYKTLWTRSTVVNALLMLLVMAPCALLGLVLGRVLPSNPDLYLDNIVLAERST